MRRMKKRINWQACLVALSCVPPIGISAQDLADDVFAKSMQGRWAGSGVYDGNHLTLARDWTLELQGQFLRADMRVEMPSGAEFGALMYWHKTSPETYRVRWMDGLGRDQLLHVTAGAEPGVYATIYLDTLAEGGPEWRAWEFETLGPDRYVERLYRVLPARRELLTEFLFDRISG